jgi:NAD-dependent DNA ligase
MWYNTITTTFIQTQMTIHTIKHAIHADMLETESLSDIIAALESADDSYFNEDGESPLTDAEYDALKRCAHMVAPTHSYFIGVGSDVRGGKVTLPNPMGSLDQVYEGDYSKWVTRHSLTAEYVVVSDKLDGTSGQVLYDNTGHLQIAYSRGNGIQGADITRHVSKIHNVKTKLKPTMFGMPTLAIRGELIISPTNFEKLRGLVKTRAGKQYKNPRNMVAGLMNSSTNPDVVYQYIDFVAYEMIGSSLNKNQQFKRLIEMGFKVARHHIHTAGSMNDDTLTMMLNLNRATTEYEIDGLVIEIDSSDVRKRVQPTTDTLNPAYAVKFKVADASNAAITEVVRVEWNISKDGFAKPRVQIKPVELVGVTIQYVTGFNAKFIRDGGVGPGAKVRITRSGDVIPFLQEVVEPVTPQLPDFECEWNSTGVDLVVVDKTNPTMRFEQLLDFFNTLDVPNLGEGNLREMFDAGFELPEDIIDLAADDVASLVGSRTIGKKIHQGLHAKLKNIPIYQLMGAHPAFGRGVGVRKMKKLWEAFEGDMSMCSDLSNITAVDGFDTKTATKVMLGLPVFDAFLSNLGDLITIQPYEKVVGGAMDGKVVVFTGFRSKDLELAVERAGGKMGSGVSSKTTYVVTENPSDGSTKLTKARELSIPIISVGELRAML